MLIKIHVHNNIHIHDVLWLHFYYYFITDVCYSADIPEVEIISLIEEQIPKYTLRADAITNFRGYCNEDWYVSTPVLPPEYEFDLSPELTEETLKYFSKLIFIIMKLIIQAHVPLQLQTIFSIFCVQVFVYQRCTVSNKVILDTGISRE